VKKRERQARGYLNATLRFAARERLIKEQGGRCASCGGHGGSRGLVLDHEHATGAPRAALCHGCNSSFGLLGESVSRIEGLLAYAKRWKGGTDGTA
jgi:hypothetical protein